MINLNLPIIRLDRYLKFMGVYTPPAHSLTATTSRNVTSGTLIYSFGFNKDSFDSASTPTMAGYIRRIS